MVENSSFDIHPENKQTMSTRFEDIGHFLKYEQVKNVLNFSCEYGYVKMLFYRSDIIRIVMNPNEELSLKTSPAIIETPDKINISVHESTSQISLQTSKLKIVINKFPFRVTIYDQNRTLLVKESDKGLGFKNKGEVICYKDIDKSDHFYGLGEKTGFLDKRGEKYEMWNSDVFAPHNPETDPLYQSIPFFMTLRNGRAHGIFFDNTYKTTFDFKSSSKMYHFTAKGGQLDYYLLSGPSPKQVLRQYTHLTGHMPIPPKWALGYHQSRYSYKSENEVRNILHTFIDKQIPVDAFYFDIHYMDEYKVFTFNKDYFPSPKKLIEEIKKAGKQVVPIVDPGVKKDPEYTIYREGIKYDYFCKYLEGDVYIDKVWPGESAFPDFVNQDVRKWWGDNHQFYTNLGVEGIWNDMNEPAVFNETKTMDEEVIHNDHGIKKTHRELHNVYGLYMGMATYEGMRKLLKGKRPFVLTRAGYAGIQRYAAVWTGDNRSFWEHLQMSVPMCLNLGLSGIPFSGADVGGFAHDTNGELLARWTQAAAFFPFFRNHSALDTLRQEPWVFGEFYEKIIKKYIELRYQWLPHFYTLFKEASEKGIPVMRPLFMEYPDDEKTTNLYDEFMIGSNVLIAPIMTPDTTYRVLYLPEGTWINYWTEEELTSGYHLIEAKLDILPIYIKKGTFIAQGGLKQSTDEKEQDLRIHYYTASQTVDIQSFELYDDDGETFGYQKGDYLRLLITCNKKENRLNFDIKKEGTYAPSWKTWKLVIHQLPQEYTVMFNDEQVKEEQIKRDTENNSCVVTINENVWM